jgi:hypothetical protein
LKFIFILPILHSLSETWFEFIKVLSSSPMDWEITKRKKREKKRKKKARLMGISPLKFTHFLYYLVYISTLKKTKLIDISSQ